MTRELKLALIVGFALVLVVTVLISDHLSHARQTKLATLPSDPAKVTEPLPIALESGANTLPQAVVTEPQPNAPAPLIGSMPSTEPDPVVIAQGRTPGTGFGATPSNTAAPIDLINPLPQSTTPAPAPTGLAANQVQPIASHTPSSGSLEEAVRGAGGRIVGDTIRMDGLVPGVQTQRQAMPNSTGATQPHNTNLPFATNSPDPMLARAGTAPQTQPTTVLPVTQIPASNDKVHTVAGGEHLFKICKQHYGDGKAWRKLAKYNNIDANTPLKIGQKLKLPTSEVLLGKPAATTASVTPNTPVLGGALLPQTNLDSVRGVSPIPGRAAVVEPKPATLTVPAVTIASKTRPYTVKKGDSLAAIAQRELGTTKRAKEIVELNKKVIKNPDNVPLGVTIQIPAA